MDGQVSAVFFDVGETLVDETRQWAGWARWLGVRPLEFAAVLGACIEADEPHTEVFQRLRPGFDLDAERAARLAAGDVDTFGPEDLFADAVPALERLKHCGYMIGVVGNQPSARQAVLDAMNLPVDVVATSEEWGVQKPDPAFFRRIVETAGLAPREIAYVGDRLDNDVLPAVAAGMVGVFVPRGPWGVIHARRPEAALATIRVDSLLDLAGRLGTWPA